MQQRKYCFSLPRASVTKCHTLGGLNNRNLLPHCSGDYKSKIKVSAVLVLSKAVRENVS